MWLATVLLVVAGYRYWLAHPASPVTATPIIQNMEFDGETMTVAFERLSKDTGVQIVVDPSLADYCAAGSMHVSLHHVDLPSALEYLLTMGEFPNVVAVRDGPVYRIIQRMKLPVVIKIYDVRDLVMRWLTDADVKQMHADRERLSRELEEVLGPVIQGQIQPWGQPVKIHLSGNSLLVSGDQIVHEKVAECLRRLRITDGEFPLRAETDANFQAGGK